MSLQTKYNLLIYAVPAETEGWSRRGIAAVYKEEGRSFSRPRYSPAFVLQNFTPHNFLPPDYTDSIIHH